MEEGTVSLQSVDWLAQRTFDYGVEGDKGVLWKTGPELMGEGGLD